MQAPSKVLVVGGGGAVGRHVARSWTSINGGEPSGTHVRVVGRDPGGLDWEGAEKVVVDLEQKDAKEKLRKAAEGADVVVHLAGPFLPDHLSQSRDKDQSRARNCDKATGAGKGFCGRMKVLEAALEAGAHYVDACPHQFWYRAIKEHFHSQAETAGRGVIVGASISPGLEGLLCKLASTKGAQSTKVATSMPGNGGLGTAFLADCIVMNALNELHPDVGGDPQTQVMVDFGDGLGKVSVRRISDSTYRGGKFAPLEVFIKQAASQLMSEQNFDSCARKAAAGKVLASAADVLSGKGCAIRVDSMIQQGTSGTATKKSVSRIYHRRASRLAADVLVAYATLLASQKVAPGVWHGSESVADEHVEEVLRLATKSTKACDLLVSPWRIASTPRELGLGIYIE